MIGDFIEVEELSRVMEVFLAGYIERDVGLTGADHEILSGICIITDLDRVFVNKLCAAFDQIKAELSEHSLQRCGHRAYILLLVCHQRIPIELALAGDADPLIAVERFFQLKGRVEKDFCVAAVVGAGASDKVAFDQSDALAQCFQQQCAVPAAVTAADKNNVITFHCLSSFLHLRFCIVWYIERLLLPE